MSDTTDHDRHEVELRLAAAGLPATDAETDRLAAGLPSHRAQVALLWAVDAARYGEPGLVFHAAPVLEDWTGAPRSGPADR